MSTTTQLIDLGQHLRALRENARMNSATVEKLTDGTVSESYLKQLENAEVRLPAPHILYALAGVYFYPYEKLMQLAGHIREPRGFCVWCNEPYYEGDKTVVEPSTREVHCSQKCLDDHIANL